jgi:hypothetical protein
VSTAFVNPAKASLMADVVSVNALYQTVIDPLAHFKTLEISRED